MKIADTLKKNRGKFVIVSLLLLGFAWWLFLNRDEIDQESVTRFAESLPQGWFIAAFFFLPMIGFPISLLLVLAGIRFGLVGGMILTTAGMLFHNFAGYHIMHGWLRQRIFKTLERRGYNIPEVKREQHIWFTVAFAAVHGPPYIAKVYLLALTDIPFVIYVFVGSAVYIAFAILPVAAGSAVMSFDPKWLYLIITFSILLVFAGLWLKKRVTLNSKNK